MMPAVAQTLRMVLAAAATPAATGAVAGSAEPAGTATPLAQQAAAAPAAAVRAAPSGGQILAELVRGAADEAHRVSEVVLGPEGLALLAGLGLVWAAASGLGALARRRRWGGVRQRSVIAISTNALALVASVWLMIKLLHHAAPMIATLLLFVGASGLVFGVGLRVRDWALGLTMVLRGRVGEGDRLTVGGLEGSVEKVGLLRVRLRGEAGEVRFVSLSTLHDASVTVASPERAYPVEVSLKPARQVDRAALARAERLAALCPYREMRSAVGVEVDAQGRVSVRFRAWSAEAARRAGAYLRTGLEKELGGGEDAGRAAGGS